MKIEAILRKISLTCLCALLSSCATYVKDEPEYTGFIEQMRDAHHFDSSELAALFDDVKINQDILKKIASPSESLPWYKYRKIFLTKKRIADGVEFWRQHQATLRAVEAKYGVPPEIVVAIIGVETAYGKHTGNYPVIEALSTLAFAYPPRSGFFRSELSHFLLLCREERISPLNPTGSYAGAMGMPQFMPSSFIHYAVDFNDNKKRDIWNETDDVIASVGYYFTRHGWQKGQPVAIKLVKNVNKTTLSLSILKNPLRIDELESANLKKTTPLFSNPKAKILAFEQQDGEELWAALHNFYVITRYNKSPLYALAVYQLSLAIANQINVSPYEKDYSDIHHFSRFRLFDQSGQNRNRDIN
jgi:membrane-bound lytic murein transglycosylase B